jgi:hypothetical protein
MATRRLALVLAGLAIAGCASSEDEDADPVQGRGYSYSLPEGWEDVSEQAKGEVEIPRFRPDTLVIGEREDDFTTNVNVVREGGVPEGVTAEDYAEVSLAGLRDPAAAGLPPELAATVEQLNPTGISRLRDRELGGEEAFAWTYRSTQAGRRVRVRQVATVMDGAGYTVTLTAVPAGFEEGAGALEEVVGSWRWE